MRVQDLEAIRIKLASPEEILSWSHGEVTKPETINYRTQRAEKDGLFDEKIFGPEKDYECYCGKYKRIRYKGIICDRCGVEVTKAQVRRERMGHIKLATPVSHIWFLRGVPSRMGMILDVPMQQLERVIYFAAYIITSVNEEGKKKVLEEIEKEYKQKLKAQSSKLKTKKEKNKVSEDLKTAKAKAREEVFLLKSLRILSEIEYHNFSLKYGEVFEAGTGAEILRKIFEKIDLKKEINGLKTQLLKAGPLNRRKILTRLKLFQRMEKAGVRPECMFLTVLPILPPDLRPMVQLDGGRYASSDLNDLYRRVINRNNRLKYLLEIDAPEVIVRNEKRMLQEAVDALIDNGMRKGQMVQATTGGKRLLKSLADILKGKQGRFRQNLLGKRVDYSGRSVIVVGPELRFNQCGLPKKMALELFKPFVIKKILDRELAYNVRGASRLIEQETDDIWAILEEIVKDKLVLLNRAPTLHRLGIQAFQPVLIEGNSIMLHPMVCRAFNADFDGDQMAVHVPLTAEAQRESREIMLSLLNLLKPATGTPVVTLYQDISLGCYWLAKIKQGAKGEGSFFGEPSEAILAYEFGEIDLKAKIKVKEKAIKPYVKKNPKANGEIDNTGFMETSVGRILFNEALPEDFPFQNSEIRIKNLETIVREIIEKYSVEETEETLDKIKELGFEYSTLSGFSWGMNDLVVPPEKGKIIGLAEKEVAEIEEYFKKGLLTREEKTNRVIEVWTKTKSEIEKLVPKALPESGSVFSFIDAGARGSWSQPVQMAGMKGLVINPVGETIELPVKSCFKEGFDVLEYFISTHGARKGTVDTALRTSTAGYLTRRLVDVAHEVTVSDTDCKDNQGIEIKRREAEEIGQNFLFKIIGRVALEKIKEKKSKGKIIVKEGEVIDWQKGEQIIKAEIEKVRVRSPLTCKIARGICQKCYGWDLGKNSLIKLGEAVGIVAAQAIGEPGTQLTMRTFHTGGVAGGGDITFGLPRVQEIFEAREPGGKAVISQVEGKILEITPERVIKIKSKIDELRSSSPFANARVVDELRSSSPFANARVVDELRSSSPFANARVIENVKSENNSQSKRKDSKDKKRSPVKKPKDSTSGFEIIEYEIPVKMGIWVEVGQTVNRGQQLCEGNLDLKELFKMVGKDETQRYVVKEIQKIYVSQGAIIHDKHIEVIVRQMFSRLKIKDPGDSSFSTGEIVARERFLDENVLLKKQNKNPAKGIPVLLGISQVSLTSDSFLSAASFQETSRILIRAAIEGKEDKLRGLKENVIIGKLIPVGTGFRK